MSPESAQCPAVKINFEFIMAPLQPQNMKFPFDFCFSIIICQGIESGGTKKHQTSSN
jgi:hypothetical protein